jgi:uncharacterized membrane protein
MKKLLLCLALFSSGTQADIIKCTFTEPFFTSTYSMTQSSLTYLNSEGKTKVLKNISFQIKARGVFDLVNRNGRIIQRLNLNYKGSDGMSDIIFPYAVIDYAYTSSANGGHGGCESNYQKAVHPGPIEIEN